jgi:hypothetical protein
VKEWVQLGDGSIERQIDQWDSKDPEKGYHSGFEGNGGK